MVTRSLFINYLISITCILFPNRAVVSVPVTSDNFWELVARNMGDKFTAKDCQEHSMETVKSPAATLSETEGMWGYRHGNGFWYMYT